MRIEALAPLRLKFKNGDTQHVQAGEVLDLSSEYALKLLKRAAGKVRAVESEKFDWLSAWRGLAGMTAGIDRDDPRFARIMKALSDCDQAFAEGNWDSFQKAAEVIRDIVAKGRA